MKIDTKNKTIELQDETLGEAIQELTKMFADNTWQAYRVVTSTIVYREYYPAPYIIPEPQHPVPYWDQWRITGGTGTSEHYPMCGTLTNCVSPHRFDITAKVE